MSRAVLVEARTYVWRSMTPGPSVAAGAAAVGVAWRGGADGLAGTVVAALVALGAASGFDDPMAAVLSASPTPLRVRAAVRAVVVGLVAAVSWTLAVVVALASWHGARLLSIEPVVYVAVVMAAAVPGMRRAAASSGASGAAALAACLFVVTQLPPPLAFAPEASHRLAWLGLLALAAAAGWRLTVDPCDERTVGRRRRDEEA